MLGVCEHEASCGTTLQAVGVEESARRCPMMGHVCPEDNQKSPALQLQMAGGPGACVHVKWLLWDAVTQGCTATRHVVTTKLVKQIET